MKNVNTIQNETQMNIEDAGFSVTEYANELFEKFCKRNASKIYYRRGHPLYQIDFSREEILKNSLFEYILGENPWAQDNPKEATYNAATCFFNFTKESL
jgi:hypothetical protein